VERLAHSVVQGRGQRLVQLCLWWGQRQGLLLVLYWEGLSLEQRLELLRVQLWMGCCLTGTYVGTVSIHSIDCIDVYCPLLPQ
ncbi:hypothetical protein AI2614V1_0830, partial [Klebsiella oxytoca]